MSLLTIYMPSRRNLSDSRSAIESALAYVDHVDGRLIISDSSGDPEKRRWLENCSPRLHYVFSEAKTAPENWRAAFSLVDTPFLLPMGDDDVIAFQEGKPDVDLGALPADVVGIRPVTQVWTLEDGVRQSDRFTIEADTTGERLFEYSRKVKGNNSVYYSIFRSEPFLSLMRLFVDHHPTKGGYIDWAICLGLFSAGRLVHDSSWTYRYDLGRWSRMETLTQTKAQLYVEAGLPADSEKYWGLLLFLDLYVFMLRLKHDAAQRHDGSMAARRLFLAPFLRDVIEKPENYDETMHYIVGMIANEQQPDAIFQLCVYLTDCIVPGLKDRYVAFIQAALAA